MDFDAREMHLIGLGRGRGRRVELESGGREQRRKEPHVFVPSPRRKDREDADERRASVPLQPPAHVGEDDLHLRGAERHPER